RPLTGMKEAPASNLIRPSRCGSIGEGDGVGVSKTGGRNLVVEVDGVESRYRKAMRKELLSAFSGLADDLRDVQIRVCVPKDFDAAVTEAQQGAHDSAFRFDRDVYGFVSALKELPAWLTWIAGALPTRVMTFRRILSVCVGENHGGAEGRGVRIGAV